MKIIGVVGLNGSGKDEVVKYLNQRYNFKLVSIGDIVREIAEKEGVEPTRENLNEITRRYFAKYGNGYFLKLVVEKIRQHQWSYAGITGIRSPEDVSILKEAFQKDFVLIHVYVTNPSIRYERMKRRGSKRDEISYTDFLREDRTTEEIFHIQEAIKMADYSIPNDGTLEELYYRVDKLVSESVGELTP